MSDIKIQPSATGSAVVTLTAPVTNTARTITLPDSTGTLATTSYDEGTWEATMLCTSGTITLHEAIRTLAYVKIGKVVTITGNLYASAISSPSGALTITGLPFANGPGNHSRVAISVDWEELNTSAATSLQGSIMEGATVIKLSRFAAGVMTTMAGDIKVGSHVRIGGSYIAAT
jgi:hypothetical protein